MICTDALRLVFGFCALADSVACTQVCRAWRGAMSDARGHDRFEATAARVQAFCASAVRNMVTHVQIAIEDGVDRPIRWPRWLRRLIVSVMLNAGVGAVVDGVLRSLAASSLRELCFDVANCDNNDTQWGAYIPPSLERLSVASARAHHANAFLELLPASRVRELCVKIHGDVEQVDLEPLARCAELRELEFDGAVCTVAQAAHMRIAAQLTKLTLSNHWMPIKSALRELYASPHPSRAALHTFVDMGDVDAALTHVSGDITLVIRTGSDFSLLPTLPVLRTVRVAHTGARPALVSALAQCRHITTLHFVESCAYGNFSSADIGAIVKHLPLLRDLSVAAPVHSLSFLDEGVLPTQLKQLTLTCTHLPVAEFSRVLGMRALQQLSVKRDTFAAPFDADAFRAHMPALRHVHIAV